MWAFLFQMNSDFPAACAVSSAFQSGFPSLECDAMRGDLRLCRVQLAAVRRSRWHAILAAFILTSILLFGAAQLEAATYSLDWNTTNSTTINPITKARHTFVVNGIFGAERYVRWHVSVNGGTSVFQREDRSYLGNSYWDPAFEYDFTNVSGTVKIEAREYTGSGAVGLVATHTWNCTVPSPPSITTHPTSQTKVVGDSVTFSVVASGTGLSYQWQKGGANITGATGASYTKTNLQTTDGGSYACIVTNAGGSVTSNSATLTVNLAPPSITTHPSNQTKVVGESVTFSVVASGASLSYQWQKGGVDISGATAASYTKTNVQIADAGSYRCVVSNSGGSVASARAISRRRCNP